MAIDTVVEEVATNLEEVAEATRRINSKSIGIFLGGAAVGLIVGIYLGRKWQKEKLRVDAFKEVDEEIQQLREHYRQKAIAAEQKPTVEEVIVEKGYDRPLKPPVPGLTEPEAMIRDNKYTDVNGMWDYERELKHRTDNPDDPYVLHQEEYMAEETGYRQVVYTYYALDDVLVGEDEVHPLPHADLIVGVNNLQFGHGTDDANVVYVRNNEHKLEMEIVRVNKSYEEEILGIESTLEDDDDD